MGACRQRWCRRGGWEFCIWIHRQQETNCVPWAWAHSVTLPLTRPPLLIVPPPWVRHSNTSVYDGLFLFKLQPYMECLHQIPPGVREPTGRGCRKNVKSRRDGGHTWTHGDWGNIQGPQFVPVVVQELKEVDTSLNQKYSPLDKLLEMKLWFLSRVSHWRNKLFLRLGCMPTSRWPQKKDLSGIFSGSLSHNVMTGLFLLLNLSFLFLFCLYIFLLSFLLYRSYILYAY